MNNIEGLKQTLGVWIRMNEDKAAELTALKNQINEVKDKMNQVMQGSNSSQATEMMKCLNDSNQKLFNAIGALGMSAETMKVLTQTL